MNDKQRKKVVQAVRDSIIAAAREAGVAKGKAAGLAKKAGEKWQETKPHQQKAVRDVKDVARSILTFSKSVAQGVKEGVKEVSKKSKPAKKKK